MIILKQAHLVSPAEGINAVGDLWMEHGKIVRLNFDNSEMPEDAKVIDCQGMYVFPGLIDVMTFCGELGLQHREDFASLSSAALAGGFTDVVIGPWGHPCTDNPAVVTDLRARSQAYPVRFNFLGSLTRQMKGEELSELGLMKEAGAIGFTDGGFPIRNTSVLRRALQYAERIEKPIFLRPADPDLEAEGVMHEGLVSTRIGLRGISEASEIIGASRLSALAQDSKARICIGPISTAKSLDYVPLLPNIDVCLPCRSLVLSDQAVESSGYDPSTHLIPPLRSDPIELQNAVRKEKLAILISDHQPLTRVEKDMEFALSTPGAMGIETALSVAFTTFQDIELVVKKMVEGPARLCGLRKGLQIGLDADIVIFKSDMLWSPKSPYRSKGINEPLDGFPLQGKVIATILREHWFSYDDEDSK